MRIGSQGKGGDTSKGLAVCSLSACEAGFLCSAYTR